MSSTDERCALNTDRELFREGEPDGPMSYYENSLHVTIDGYIGMNVGGTVIVKSIADWHALSMISDERKELLTEIDSLRENLDLSLKQAARRRQKLEKIRRVLDE